jgi:hypothetical protein
MSNNTQALSAAEKLAELEQAAEDGEDVTAAQLAEAKAEVELEQHKTRGAIKRAEKARLRAEAEEREQAKKDAVGMLDGYPQRVIEAYDAAVAALETLVTEAETYSDKINEIGRHFRRHGVSVQSDWTRFDPPEHHDPAFTAMAEQGGAFPAVVIAGEVHRRTSSGGRYEAGPWVAAAVEQVARAHGGLPIARSESIENAVHRSKPQLLQDRKAAR